jgi:hypothetical protein
MTALALGGVISSPGQPKTVTLPGDFRASEVFDHGDGGRDADGSLSAVLISVKGPAGSAQGVVFQNDSKIGRSVGVSWAGVEGPSSKRSVTARKGASRAPARFPVNLAGRFISSAVEL